MWSLPQPKLITKSDSRANKVLILTLPDETGTEFLRDLQKRRTIPHYIDTNVHSHRDQIDPLRDNNSGPNIFEGGIVKTLNDLWGMTQ